MSRVMRNDQMSRRKSSLVLNFRGCVVPDSRAMSVPWSVPLQLNTPAPEVQRHHLRPLHRASGGNEGKCQ